MNEASLNELVADVGKALRFNLDDDTKQSIRLNLEEMETRNGGFRESLSGGTARQDGPCPEILFYSYACTLMLAKHSDYENAAKLIPRKAFQMDKVSALSVLAGIYLFRQLGDFDPCKRASEALSAFFLEAIKRQDALIHPA